MIRRMTTSPEGPPRGRHLDRDADIADLLKRTRSIAVLGIKTEAQADQPAFYVPQAAQRAGYAIVPVPVYYPEATEILGEKVFRSVAGIGAPVDLVDVFRRPRDLAGHLDDLLAARPRAVWLQSGIRDDDFAARLVEAGIDVVQDRCLMVEIRRHGARPPAS
jgi:predicted CoA-binding protein